MENSEKVASSDTPTPMQLAAGLANAQQLLGSSRNLIQVLHLLRSIAESFDTRPTSTPSIVSQLPAISDASIRCDICRRTIAEVIMILRSGSPKREKVATQLLNELYTALASLQAALAEDAAETGRSKKGREIREDEISPPGGDVPF